MKKSLWVVCLVGCSSWVEGESEGFRHLTAEVTSGSNGHQGLKIEVEDGETGMLVVANPDPPDLALFEFLDAPGGAEVYEVDADWATGRNKTGAKAPATVVAMNWPIVPGDADLAPGRWKTEIGTVDSALYYTGGIIATIDVLLKRDADLTSGVMEVAVVYAGSAASDDDLLDAMDDAEDIWGGLYAQIGVDLSVSEYTWDNGELWAPGSGSSDDYWAISEMVGIGVIPVVIAPELQQGAGIYGVAGGIPGSLVPSERSAVAVSALTNSGPDGRFDAEETRLLAETLAHEVLHYAGLFHPVERTWDAWDVLDDTPECASQATCSAQLGDNLMFPYPICSSTGCRAQDVLTTDQGASAHRYTGVR